MSACEGFDGVKSTTTHADTRLVVVGGHQHGHTSTGGTKVSSDDGDVVAAKSRPMRWLQLKHAGRIVRKGDAGIPRVAHLQQVMAMESSESVDSVHVDKMQYPSRVRAMSSQAGSLANKLQPRRTVHSTSERTCADGALHPSVVHSCDTRTISV